jgi:hypothetical protein
MNVVLASFRFVTCTIHGPSLSPVLIELLSYSVESVIQPNLSSTKLVLIDDLI